MLGVIDAKPKVGYFLGENAGPDGMPSKRRYDTKVKEVQGVPIVIRDTTTVHDAVVTLFVENVGSLIVVAEDGELTGIVSRKDLLKVTLGNAQSGSMPVSLVMTRQPNIVTVSPDDSVLLAAEKMIVHEVDSLPVVKLTAEGNSEVVGRLTKTTMTRLLLDMLRT